MLLVHVRGIPDLAVLVSNHAWLGTRLSEGSILLVPLIQGIEVMKSLPLVRIRKAAPGGFPSSYSTSTSYFIKLKWALGTINGRHRILQNAVLRRYLPRASLP